MPKGRSNRKARKAAAIVPFAYQRPTAEREAHNDIEPAGAARRIKPVIRSLLETRQITQAHFDALDYYREQAHRAQDDTAQESPLSPAKIMGGTRGALQPRHHRRDPVRCALRPPTRQPARRARWGDRGDGAAGGALSPTDRARGAGALWSHRQGASARVPNGGKTMNALATILPPMSDEPITALSLALPDTTDFPTWLAEGRRLATSKRHIDWLIGDWIAFGRTHFPEQIDLALADLSDDPRNLKRIEKTAATFPPHLRDAALTFEHHAHVADMPVQEALPLLKQAHEEDLTARQLRIRAMLRKVETGQVLPREDDAADDMLLALCRAWNRATRDVRSEFAEMIADSDLGIVEP